MSVDNDVRLLIITEHSYNWFDLLLEEKIIRTVEIASTFGEFEKFTSDQVIDIILLEAELFGDNLEPVINKITLQSPRSLVAVLTNDISNEYYDCVVSMGVVDVLPMDVKPSYMIQRINALLHRWQDQVDAESRTRKLQAISVLSQKLHESENPSIMFVTAIDFICTYFDVLGVAITLQNNDGMRLYAGSEDIDNHRRLYESHSMMNVHDPLRQVIITGMPLVFSDISEHMHFTPIPVISNPKMALIVPFRNASRIVGSLAVFSSDDSLSWTDVAIFELIALNLGTAYFNTTHYHMQEVSVQSMRYVIQAWYRLSSVYDRNEIAELTYDHIIDAVDMNAAGIWLFSPDDNPDVIYSGNPLLQDVLQEIYELGAQNLILQDFEHSLRPVTLHYRMINTSPITRILDVIDALQITFIPISGDTFDGIIVAIPNHSEELSYGDISLIESLARVVANTLERNILIESLQSEQTKLKQQTGRIEGLLSTIHEGIVFVNEKEIVEYCNPQLTDLTGLNPLDILQQPVDDFIDSLIKNYSETESKRKQLKNAAKSNMSGELGAYPIVELEDSHGTTMFVEFMPANFTSEEGGYICVITPRTTIQLPPSNVPSFDVLNGILEEISEPLVALSARTSSLPEQYELLGSRKFQNALNELDRDSSNLQTKWSTFLQVYKGETQGYDVDFISLDVADFLSNLLSSRYIQPYREHIQIDSRVLNGTVEIDEKLMQQTVANIINFIFDMRPLTSTISIIVDHQASDLTLRIQGESNSVPPVASTPLPVAISEDENLFRPEIHLANTIIQLHRGKLTIFREKQKDIMLEIELPLLKAEGRSIAAPVVADISPYKPPKNDLTIMILESQSNLASSLIPYIEGQSHQVYTETMLNDIILNLRITKVDLILLEIDHAHADVLDNIQQIRNHSEVPIVILALEEFEDKCVKCLKQGADDYFLIPINKDKFLAQLHAMSKRQELAARTSEPVTVGDLTVDLSGRRVYLEGKPVDLTTREYQILQVLVMNRGEVMSHAQILSKVWGPEYKDEKQYLWVNISRLRQKIEPPGDSPRYIHNEPRVGYVFSIE